MAPPGWSGRPAGAGGLALASQASRSPSVRRQCPCPADGGGTFLEGVLEQMRPQSSSHGRVLSPFSPCALWKVSRVLVLRSLPVLKSSAAPWQEQTCKQAGVPFTCSFSEYYRAPTMCQALLGVWGAAVNRTETDSRPLGSFPPGRSWTKHHR